LSVDVNPDFMVVGAWYVGYGAIRNVRYQQGSGA
jgi:hypothetical protein